MNYNFKHILVLCVFIIIVTLLVSLKIERHTVKLLQDEVSHQETRKAPPQPTETIVTVDLEVCSTNTFKSFMDYRAITNQSSNQWKLQQQATTNENGMRTVNGYILVAMTSNYGNVGDILTVTFENITIEVMLGDIKDAGHDSCQSNRDGSMIEFIVDTKTMDKKVKRLGSYEPIYQGSILKIEKEIE